MWPQTQDSEAGVKDYAAELEGRRQAELDRYRASIKDAIMQSWPAELAKSAYGAATLPGDVYAGRVDPMSDEAVGRSAELAGLLTLGAGGIPAGRNEMRMGIKAYHGSPHDFDQFSMSKIGTGEGAQAYGHGLYFAGNDAVARGYRDSLTPDHNLRISGKPIQDVYRSLSNAADQMPAKQSEAGYNRLALVEDLINGGDVRHVRDLIKEGAYDAKTAAWFEKEIAPKFSRAGRMYEVELNTTPDRLLDWDAALPPAARQIAQERLGDMAKFADTGGSLVRKVGSVDVVPDLKRAGFDGIKYLDAGSRAAGDGSRNYVMFDDKLIKILRKYGVATAAALPAAALAELGLSRKEAERTF